MLDTDTKRRIDTARDILVGKVPDPKSQVEQITIALIYKFMDDMDAESEELGGKRKFFTGDFARYGWAKLMAPSLGGHEMLGLYGEGISKMPENPGIPPLFRDIFKNAYLPYRDPETLKAFLKIIDEFSYDHSERLGDAFEYLLSVLGSQGDAGQFRTPRHIIDFIVVVVDPKKDETILDPACGTAGFLISAYKHILRANTDAKGHSKLTPDDRGRLAKNFKGYDISPDMVRLSLVNLYLHGFTDPHIYEYDTLTSEERWSEFADVILANPPFMSPKGGIKPHRRFSIQAKRSEVLFVDYMAEHLTPAGRAGIIVPEGIIFQSQDAYKILRKMLVDNSLVAVVSLPAGCFNPYSGVKTSILILDKSLARQSDTIGFFKVENDGFGLGAQRRAIEKNDLPQVQAELTAYLQALRSKASIESILSLTSTAQIVPKEKIAASGDYNLSGERYREGAVAVSSWPFVPVGDVFRKADQTVLPESLDGPVTYLGLENITQNTGEIEGDVVTEKPADIKSLKNVFKPRDILYGKLRPNLNKVWLADRKGICSTDIFVIEAIEGTTDPALYAYLFRSARFNDAVMGQLKGAQLPRIGWSSFAELQIPLPPLDVQKKIVVEIEGYQKVINGARAVLEYYRPHIPIHPDWPLLRFEDAPFEIIDGDRGTNYPKKEDFSPSGYCLFLNTKNVRSDGFSFSEMEFVSKEKDESLRKGKLHRGDVVLTTRGTIGNTGFYDDTVEFDHIRINSGMLVFRPDATQLSGSFLYHFFQSENFHSQRDAIVSGAAQPQLPIRSLNDATIPVPPLATQQAIVAEIETERALVAANRGLITRFEQKIQASLARIWGDEARAAPEV
jgi:type I restriction enzyme M protein